MHSAYIDQKNSPAWDNILGRSRDAIIGDILEGNWFSDPSPTSLLAVSELRGALALGFTLFRDFRDAPALLRKDHIEDRQFYRVGTLRDPSRLSQFDIIFNREGNPRDIELHEVYFLSKKPCGMGKNLLINTFRMALKIGCERVFVRPWLAGSWYWLSRGALLQTWPLDVEGLCALRHRIGDLLKNRCDIARLIPEKDLRELEHIWKNRDCFGLNQFVARDDLFAWKMPDRIPLSRYLMENFLLDYCIFDLKNEFTRNCLLKHTGFDINAPQKSFPTRPHVSGECLPLTQQRHLVVADL